jgi:CheY-like chemotaxis protein
MSSVQWVTHDGGGQPVTTENDLHPDLDEIVASCITRLPSMRLTYAQTPPDGFLVFDSSGKEVRRWFGSVRTKVEEITARWAAQGPLKTASVRRMEKNASRRVLVIDDDQSVRLAIEISLRRRGCLVVLADSGRRALTAFKPSEFDLVMVDMFMPEMEGVEVIKALRERAPAIPIIAMSGYRSLNWKSAPNFLEMAVKLGATSCLAKPFWPQQLLAVIDTCFAENIPETARGGH